MSHATNNIQLGWEELEELLRLDGLPDALCKHIGGDPSFYTPLVNQAIADKITPLMLQYHQLQAVAAIVCHTSNCSPQVEETQGHISSNAHAAIREGWGSVPGIALVDDVRLGKMVTILAAIAMVVQLCKHQQRRKTDSQHQLPEWCPSTWGCINEIPDAPHLIIAPTSLVRQWESEISWHMDIQQAAASPLPPSCQIWLTLISVVTQMAQSTLHSRSGLRHPAVIYPLPLNQSLFTHSFSTLIVDEAHEVRMGGKAFIAIDGLSSLGLFKIYATAMPLVDGSWDLLNLAHLVHCRT
ncbi:hypothetical protein C8J57DRAFT_1501900 [Mycena rebaudengoi]|nr:hypothetical protein C8J57DRAFT_1501900 [Mycena rebaudengoi]